MAQRNEELQFAREECIAENPEIVHQNDVAIAEISGPLITFPPFLATPGGCRDRTRGCWSGGALISIRLSEGVNHRGWQGRTGKPVQQADGVAGENHAMANEREPFETNGLGTRADPGRERLHD